MSRSILNTPIQSDIFSFVSKISDNSVQTLVTSPPYFGLRNYKIPNRTWGGDPSCVHHFSGKFAPKTKMGMDESGFADPKWKSVILKANKIEYTQFCTKCWAWYGSLGSEPFPELFVKHLVEIFQLIRPKLRDDGTMWINIGDSRARSSGSWGITADTPSVKARGGKMNFADVEKEVNPTTKPPFLNFYQELGYKAKDLVGIPWAFAFAMRSAGWYLRQDIIWAKPNPRPEPVKDRCTVSHEYIFLFSKKERYYYDRFPIMEALAVPKAKGIKFGGVGRAGGDNPLYSGLEYDAASIEGRNARSVWNIKAGGSLPKSLQGKHFAAYPDEIPRRCILAGSPHKVCANCRSPYVRIIVRKGPNKAHQKASGGKNGQYKGKSKGDPESSGAQNASDLKRNILESMDELVTEGYEATCKCATETIKPLIFDPFMGTFTTAVVAEKLHRDWIGCDIAERFVDLGKKRLALQVRHGRKIKQLAYL